MQFAAISIPDSTPSQKAHLELLALATDPELQADSVIGGPTPASMHEENKRREVRYRERRLEIIGRHGVVDEYLEPLLEEEQQLEAQLLEKRRDIAALKALRSPAEA